MPLWTQTTDVEREQGRPRGRDDARAGTAGQERERQIAGLTPPSHRGRSNRLIGDVVVDLGFASRAAVDDAVSASRSSRKTTGQVLLDRKLITADQLARAVAERFGLDHVDLSVAEVDMGAANLIGMDAAKRYDAVPIAFLDHDTLLVAMADPTNVLAVDDIAMITGLEVCPAAAAREDVRMLISRLNRLDEAVDELLAEEPLSDADVALELEAADETPVIKLVHSLIANAVDLGASDIHFNPGERDMTVLYRVDGVLNESATVPRRLVPGVVSRIKIMADLDIAEKRAPQDGRLRFTVDGRRVDIRVVTLPVVGGESVVLRVLDQGIALRNLDGIGIEDEARGRLLRALGRPHGAILVTGPTGSGKSTTLYAALALINDGKRSILTIEDPVESTLPGVKQMQIAPKAGVSFATGLRSMMRADPDVIMVGEIRDRETALIAVEAALTGHLMLSTLHTNDAPSALTRLIEMGIEPFLVASSIECVVAQRLARVLCEHCKTPAQIPSHVLDERGLGGVVPYEAVGCGRCAHTGYRGRTGLYEVMNMSDEIRALVLERRAAEEIAVVAVEQGMPRLSEDGIAKIRAGITSIAEVARLTDAW